MSLSYDIPEDIVHLILLKLPEKSLVRFKIVSKSWNAQISCPKFIMLRLNQSHTNPNMLLCRYERYINDRQLLVLEFSTQENLVGIIHRLHHPYHENLVGFGLHDQPFIVGGPCNGLLCLKQRRGELFTLCNPFTKSFWPLPAIRVRNDVNRRYYAHSRFNFYGFGYDDVHDDYKLFIAWSAGTVHGLDGVIYSLKSNSWTLYQDLSHYEHFYSIVFLEKLDGVLVNCALHWAVCNNYTRKSCILAFDLRAEKHKYLQIPKGLENNFLELSVLNDCLLVKSNNDFRFESFDMWVMKDYGLKDSWIKITMHMPFHIWSLTPAVHFESKKRMVFYNHREGRMLLYDLDEDEVLDTRIIPDATPT